MNTFISCLNPFFFSFDAWTSIDFNKDLICWLFERAFLWCFQIWIILLKTKIIQTQTAHHHRLQTVNGTMMLKTMLTRLTRIIFKRQENQSPAREGSRSINFHPRILNFLNNNYFHFNFKQKNRYMYERNNKNKLTHTCTSTALENPDDAICFWISCTSKLVILPFLCQK